MTDIPAMSHGQEEVRGLDTKSDYHSDHYQLESASPSLYPSFVLSYWWSGVSYEYYPMYSNVPALNQVFS